MQRGILYYLGITLIILLLFGVISIGDVLGLFFFIFLGILLLLALGLIAFRIYVLRLRKKAEEEFGSSGDTHTFFWTNRRNVNHNTSSRKKDGEVTIEMPAAGKKKRVGKNVGDYVDFEDVGKNDN